MFIFKYPLMCKHWNTNDCIDGKCCPFLHIEEITNILHNKTTPKHLYNRDGSITIPGASICSYHSVEYLTDSPTYRHPETFLTTYWTFDRKKVWRILDEVMFRWVEDLSPKYFCITSSKETSENFSCFNLKEDIEGLRYWMEMLKLVVDKYSLYIDGLEDESECTSLIEGFLSINDVLVDMIEDSRYGSDSDDMEDSDYMSPSDT